MTRNFESKGSSHMQFRLVLFLLSLLTVMLLGGLGPRPAWVSTGRVEAKLHQATERH